MKTKPILILLAACIALSACGTSGPAGNTAGSPSPSVFTTNGVPTPTVSSAASTVASVGARYIDSSGSTVRTRVLTPAGFVRKKADAYGEYLRSLPLKPDGSPVLLYNGEPKANQSAHIAVLAIDTGTRDRQQCADAALRLRCEYLFSAKRLDAISYHFTNGFSFPYAKYREGYRLKLEGGKTALVKSAGKDTSYAAFRRYLDVLFAYAGTLSLAKECRPVAKPDMRIGDIFIRGGSPGHCVIVIDLCENPTTGEKAFLLAQGYMPAQEIHILKNPAGDSPWYTVSGLAYPFTTPEYTFPDECLMRMP